MSKIVLIMAGGLGKRMNSDLPKVLHLLNNKPLIVHWDYSRKIWSNYSKNY
jgi:bifunctional N-acetylglucosamine-1-phosphate-uridyltransferase/glucosamine-1-phosphate-acetyltransferase GlmU-like protein